MRKRWALEGSSMVAWAFLAFVWEKRQCRKDWRLSFALTVYRCRGCLGEGTAASVTIGYHLRYGVEEGLGLEGVMEG